MFAYVRPATPIVVLFAVGIFSCYIAIGFVRRGRRDVASALGLVGAVAVVVTCAVLANIGPAIATAGAVIGGVALSGRYRGAGLVGAAAYVMMMAGFIVTVTAS